MKNINIAIIGAGSMGKTHSYSVKNLPFFYKDLPFKPILHTLCSRSEQKANVLAQTADFLHVECDFDKLLANPEIDIIDICTPNTLHCEQIQKAFKAGKHIMCEKPLVSTKEESDAIINTLSEYKNSGLIHRIVFNNRHMPVSMRAAQLVSEGRLGRILSFRSVYRHSSAADPTKQAGWKQYGEFGGGVLFDLGSHAIDLLSFILGRDENRIDSVSGVSQIAYEKRIGMDGKEWIPSADEAFYMTARLKSGAVGTIEASKVATGTNDDFAIEIFGTDGALRFSIMEPNYLYFYDNNKPSSPFGGEKGFTAIECVQRYNEPGGVFPSFKAPIGWLRGHVHNMYELFDSVYTGTPSTPDFYDGLYVNAVIYAGYLSEKNGKWEKVDFDL